MVKICYTLKRFLITANSLTFICENDCYKQGFHFAGSEEKHKNVFSGWIIGGVTFVILLVLTGVAVWCYLLMKAKVS